MMFNDVMDIYVIPKNVFINTSSEEIFNYEIKEEYLFNALPFIKSKLFQNNRTIIYSVDVLSKKYINFPPRPIIHRPRSSIRIKF